MISDELYDKVWDIIATVRDEYPRDKRDAPTGEIVEAFGQRWPDLRGGVAMGKIRVNQHLILAAAIGSGGTGAVLVLFQVYNILVILTVVSVVAIFTNIGYLIGRNDP